MADEKLLSVEEFNALVRKWSQQVKMSSSGTLSSNTHASGKLLQSLQDFVDTNDKTKAAYKVKFRFERYGVFRAYGVGRGYVRYNGVVKRGYRLKTVLDYASWEKVVKRSLQQGMKSKEINALKEYTEGNIRRTPLDWIDHHIESNINTLASSVQEFYGDRAMQAVLDSFNDIKINKNG